MTANAGFFRGQEAPAVLKHGILKRYPVVFAAAAGGNAPRVVLLDGYAGRGEYEDGTPGSPRLLLNAASATGSFRNVECVFVELDRSNFETLQGVVKLHGAGLACSALQGDLSRHLPSILKSASDAALLAFLDPFGTALDYSELSGQLLARPKYPPTEVLLHVSVNAVRRIGGLLRARGEELSEADRKTIARVDRFLGGDWWREIALGANDEPGVATKIAEQVIDAYCRKVSKDTGSAAFWFPVRDRPDLSPEYFLVLFARHPYAIWRFNDCLSKANVEWQEAWRGRANAKANEKLRKAREKEAAQGLMSLFGDDDAVDSMPAFPPFDEIAEAERWVDVIQQNLTRLFKSGTPFKLMDHISSVYDGVLGEAREMHVSRAIKRLFQAGISADDGSTKGIHERVMRAGPNALQSDIGPSV